MPHVFPTESELMVMPLNVVRSLDIQSSDEERLVQRVVDKRISKLPPSQPVFRKDVPDIQDQEEEAEWQSVIDKRTAKLKNPLMNIDNTHIKTIKAAKQQIDPTDESFDPSTADIADEAKPSSPKANAPMYVAGQLIHPDVVERMKKLEQPEAGTPITLGGNPNVPRKAGRPKKNK